MATRAINAAALATRPVAAAKRSRSVDRRAPLSDEGGWLRDNPVNPFDIFGEDVVTILWMAIGLAGTQLVDDKLVTPVIGPLIPASSGVIGEVVDVITTGLSAWALGEIVSFADGHVGRRMRQGGMVLAGGKLIAIPVPGFKITGQITGFGINIPGLTSASKTAAGAGSTALAGLGGTSSQAGNRLSSEGYGSTGL